jgi:glyoxylase-like metal-dependent hydrolase (beta-lactamase superfamily II)
VCSSPPVPAAATASRGYDADPLSGAASRLITVGSRELHALSDGYLLMSPDLVGSPDCPTAGYDALAAEHTVPRLPLGCFLIPGPVITLVDTGMGPTDFQGEGRLVGGRLLEALAGIGVRPEQVGAVALSHLHGDHSGTLGDLATGAPTFPNATLFLGSGDWDHFVTQPAAPFPMAPHVASALDELRRQDRIVLMDDAGDVAPGVRRTAAAGHTPGHSFYTVSDGDERVVLTGDAMHCPQQLDHPEWGVTFDVDPRQAHRTRERLRDDLRTNGGAALGSHFPGLTPVRPA